MTSAPAYRGDQAGVICNKESNNIAQGNVCNFYCVQNLSEEQRTFKSVYSKIPISLIDYLLYQMEGGKNRVGSKQKRENERKGLTE